MAAFCFEKDNINFVKNRYKFFERILHEGLFLCIGCDYKNRITYNVIQITKYGSKYKRKSKVVYSLAEALKIDKDTFNGIKASITEYSLRNVYILTNN